MSAGDLAAVVVTLLSIVAVVVLLFAAQALLRSVRALRDAVDELRSETVPTVVEMRRNADLTRHELERVEVVLDRAQAISARADAASRLGWAVAVNPVVRLWAAVAGTNRAARRLRDRT